LFKNIKRVGKTAKLEISSLTTATLPSKMIRTALLTVGVATKITATLAGIESGMTKLIVGGTFLVVAEDFVSFIDFFEFFFSVRRLVFVGMLSHGLFAIG
jgi:hypothetical protein